MLSTVSELYPRGERIGFHIKVLIYHSASFSCGTLQQELIHQFAERSPKVDSMPRWSGWARCGAG